MDLMDPRVEKVVLTVVVDLSVVLYFSVVVAFIELAANQVVTDRFVVVVVLMGCLLCSSRA